MLEGSILKNLVTNHQKANQPINLGVYYKNTLVALCHALEDFILESSGAPLMITAFQQGKWYLQEAERYGEIAEKAWQIAIMATPGSGFAEHPTSQKENVALVSLAGDDPVAEEWHLIILSPSYAAMVLCQELSPEDYGSQGQPAEDLERKFYGFWTFEPELVRETVELAIAHIGNYNQDLQSQLATQIQEILTESGSSQRDDLGLVVGKVVTYLQNSQTNLSDQVSAGNASSGSQALDENLVSNKMQAFLRLAQLIDQADVNNTMAASQVAALAEAMGQFLDLPAWQIKRLRLSSLLHRLAPSLVKAVSGQDSQAVCSHVSNVEALRLMPRLKAIAHIITHQTECWDGSGKPEGLAYDAIPLESRIIGLLAYFQERRSAYEKHTGNNPLAQALDDCQTESGQTFDPKLVEALSLLVMGMQQGMNIQAIQPKIATGIWLLDDYHGQVVSNK